MTAPSQKTVKGPIHAVPCPHCGRANNLKTLQEQVHESFEPGLIVDCDFCGMCSKVVAVQPIVFVALIQDPEGRSRQQRRAAPAGQRAPLPRAIVRRGAR